MTPTWDGDEYQLRFDALAASGQDMHGEARFVLSYSPTSVLDAGCGTGRVAIELGHRGVEVVGVDQNRSMLRTARERAEDIEWIEADLTELELGRTFDVVVMAGNVPLFAAPGTQPALIARTAAHVAPGGMLVAGFATDWSDRLYGADEHDEHCAAAGLIPVERYGTWDRDEWTTTSTYAVCVAHRPD